MKSFGIKKSHKLAEVYTVPDKSDSGGRSYMDDDLALHGLELKRDHTVKQPKGSMRMRQTEHSSCDFF